MRLSKYQLFDKYVDKKIYRADIEKIGFHNVDLFVYRYCLKNKVNYKPVNHEYWILVDEPLPKKVVKEMNEKTRKRLDDIYWLSFKKYKEKHPKTKLYNNKFYKIKKIIQA